MAPQAPAGLCEVLGPEDAVTRGEVLSRVLPSLVADVRRFEREGFGPFAQAFAERDALAGLSVTLSDGQQGVACGLDAQGGLQVQTAQGMMAVTSSTVSVRPC
jgi:BirA family biotin operon repressor/biotin-[acetyl-CoA-carboxylase] ligase